MARKTVLVLEDDVVMRKVLEAGLAKRGIDALAAASPDEAWALLKNAPDIDVALLDIRLGDGPIESGLDFGMRMKNDRGERPPEFLIHSAYDSVDYYQIALQLGAAAYFQKGNIENTGLSRVEVLAQHVRALALRRALRSADIAGRLKNIAATSGSRDEAIVRFCREVLSEEIEAAIGPAYILLLTAGGATTPFSGRPLAPAMSAALERLQSVIHARLGSTEPLILSSSHLFFSSADDADASQLGSMEGAAFINLGEFSSARLSLGLLPGEQSPAGVREQAGLLDRYLQRSVIAHLLEITEMWSDMELARETTRRETLLRATTDFYLSQSQLLASLVGETEKQAGDTQEWPSLTNLRNVADEMRDAGELLVHFGTTDNRADDSDVVPVDMAELIQRIWDHDVSARLRIRAPHVLRLDGRHCVARQQVARAERTVSQIMSWLARRLVRRDGEPLPELLVLCVPVDGSDRVRIIFEERHSPRLTREARETLFTPFSRRDSIDLPNDVVPGRRLGLYLAQTLAELAGGTLTDQSDELGGTHGHRFVLELPAAKEPA